MLKVDDVARCLGLTRSTVYDWIARGYLPCHRFGRTIRVSSDDLRTYLAGSRINELATERELRAQEEVGVAPKATCLDESPTRLARIEGYDPISPTPPTQGTSSVA